jgi:hypothetical protein
MQTFATLEEARHRVDISSAGDYPSAMIKGRHVPKVLKVELESGEVVYIHSTVPAEMARQIINNGNRHLWVLAPKDIEIRRVIDDYWTIENPDNYFSEAEIAYREVEKLWDEAEKLHADDNHDPEQTLNAYFKARAALKEWENNYPEAAKAKQETANQSEQARQDRLKQENHYQRAREMRD